MNVRSDVNEAIGPEPLEALKRINDASQTRAVELSLWNYGLSVVPPAAFNLTALQALDLHGNKLRELSESISNLTELQSLNLRGNKLRNLPDSISKLTNLESLNLRANQLTELPESITKLTRLKFLSLGGNQLTELPESISNLTQLEILDLRGNQLKELPESISKLTQLQFLSLGGNQLKKLPESIGKLTQLPFLSLDGNHLTELPESISRLSSQLRILDLRDNQLTELPESMVKLALLERLLLQGNDGLGLPAEVLGPIGGEAGPRNPPAKPDEILEYYFRVRGEKRPLNEAKLILVGRGDAGKTSVVNRLVTDVFRTERKTEGIKITEWKLLLNGNEDVRLNVWDFGGQEIMHATHQFFFTRRSLYLLVLNGREGGEDVDAEYWLKLIESFGGDSPVIVVLNKIKEHPFDVNRRALQQKYPSIREFIKTDCRDRTGIDELDKAIRRETDRLEHLRDAFPASWFMVKDRLAGMRKNFLSFEDYRKQCAKLGEKDPKAQEALAFYLNSLGIALNFRDDPRLQDTHVLNPRWVTNGIYKLLNSAQLAKQKGEIRLSDLSSVLEAKQYPAHMHRFLFDLMRKFDLCFSFPDDDTHYLIPELLDKQEPPETSEFNVGECLNLQYHYPVLPEGLLPRFIVRTHALSEGLPRWRTGVILQFEGCRGLVKADVQDKKVFISVNGPVLSRRRLLSVIRSDVERINRDIRNLQPQEMVPIPDYPTAVLPYEKLLAMERQGIGRFPEFVGDKVVELEVADLISGLRPEHPRQVKTYVETSWGSREKATLFISYSHKDDGLRSELDAHLKILQRSQVIDVWHDRRLSPGDDWKKKIDDNLDRADIILLLVSADFIASDYCFEIEAKKALERHENGQAVVIPVILRSCKWQVAEFASLQALPKDGLPITKWADKDSAWLDVEEGIERVVKEMCKKPSRL